jgi:3-dehydroquinate synthetase
MKLKNITTLRCGQESATPIVEVQISGPVLSKYGPGGESERAIIFADAAVWAQHEPMLSKSFRSAYKQVELCLLTGGEDVKEWSVLCSVLERLSALGVRRRGEALFVLGGGTVLDVVGLAASIYRRGVALTKIPTSLMAQVDAAIGLKNAINFDKSKNLVGTFSPPHSVLIDLCFLKTLPARHWSNGISEVIKLGLVCDVSLIQDLISLSAAGTDIHDLRLQEIVRRAIIGTVKELNTNPYEYLLERALDFGHWLSPLIEMESPSILHGEAVSIDMAISLTISLGRKLLSEVEWESAIDLLESWNLPTTYRPLTGTLIQDALAKSRQHRGGSQNIPLCIAFGAHSFFNDITVQEVLTAHELILRRAKVATVPSSSVQIFVREAESVVCERGNVDERPCTYPVY